MSENIRNIIREELAPILKMAKEMNKVEKQYYSVTEASELTGFSRQKIRDSIDAGLIKAKKVGPKGCKNMISKEELNKFSKQ